MCVCRCCSAPASSRTTRVLSLEPSIRLLSPIRTWCIRTYRHPVFSLAAA